VDDDLDRYRKQYEEERKAADEARARNEAKRAREKAYEAAWGGVFRELRRVEGEIGSPLNLVPLEELVIEFKNGEELQWLVEMEENFKDQLDRGFDNDERSRRAELWFVRVLLALGSAPPARERADLLLTEMRQRGFSRFGVAGIAGNIHEYLQHHPEAWEQRRRQKHADMLEKAGAVVCKLAIRKPAIRRNLTFATWSHDEKLTPSKTRDRWSTEQPESENVGDGSTGIGIVKQGLRAAQSFLKDLAAAGFSLTAGEALERLPSEK